MIRRLLLAACPLLTLAAAPQDVPAPVAIPTPAPSPTHTYATVSVTVTTSEGPIVVALERERAPVTTANFLRYVDAKRFDGTAFYRAMPLGEVAGLIQGGVRNRSDLIFPPIAHEPTTKTRLTHDDGAISLARAAPGSGRGDFFIVVGSVPTLDADPNATADKLGYAAFGHVTAGMDIVRHILRAPTAAGGPPGMKGQILAAPVKIVTVRRVVAKR